MLESIREYDIPSEISQEIIASIQGALSATLDSFNSSLGDPEVFLRIYISSDAQKGSQIRHDWGYFRIERNSTTRDARNAKRRQIEIYLYLDGGNAEPT
jgi:hypothetical protein